MRLDVVVVGPQLLHKVSNNYFMRDYIFPWRSYCWQTVEMAYQLWELLKDFVPLVNTMALSPDEDIQLQNLEAKLEGH